MGFYSYDLYDIEKEMVIIQEKTVTIQILCSGR